MFTKLRINSIIPLSQQRYRSYSQQLSSADSPSDDGKQNLFFSNVKINFQFFSYVGEFRVLNLKKTNVRTHEVRRNRLKPMPVPPPRFQQMPVDQDWGAVWPAPRSFHPGRMSLQSLLPYKFYNYYLFQQLFHFHYVRDMLKPGQKPLLASLLMLNL